MVNSKTTANAMELATAHLAKFASATASETISVMASVKASEKANSPVN